MKYRLLCSDLDGTLLTTKDDVSEVTISQISRIKSSTSIILVSARMPQSIIYLQKRLDILEEPIICYNGALILKGSQEILSVTIPISDIEEIQILAKTYGIHLGLYYKEEWYVPTTSERVQKEIRHTRANPIYESTTTTLNHWKKRDIGAHKIMLMGTKLAMDEVFEKLRLTLNSLQFYRSNDTLIEVAPKAISKHSAILKVLPPKTSMNDVIAFGDNYNDIEMLTHASCGVAMGNAREEVKQIANYTTLKNTEDGVAHFIQEHL
ncbi:Cof-type HAD-IIB family hydrolase [Spongiimicrobium salis]|uniref:Cof-type HAD-IIB family hydrolase n=1 Tax=Spongiimicrobium salis TaxID=1667022 RepID=UPI00374DB66C